MTVTEFCERCQNEAAQAAFLKARMHIASHTKIYASISGGAFDNAGDAKSAWNARPEPEEVHGYWIEDNPRPKSYMWYCSMCRWKSYDITPTKSCSMRYCPHCGARMDKDKEEKK